MVIDYVWHFQAPPREPTHFGPDYWMPAPALVMAGAERIFGLSPATPWRPTFGSPSQSLERLGSWLGASAPGFGLLRPARRWSFSPGRSLISASRRSRRLEHGCLHLVCRECGYSELVAFSCKQRGFCPSCLGRRMADTAVHLEQSVLPRVPIRH